MNEWRVSYIGICLAGQHPKMSQICKLKMTEMKVCQKNNKKKGLFFIEMKKNKTWNGWTTYCIVFSESWRWGSAEWHVCINTWKNCMTNGNKCNILTHITYVFFCLLAVFSQLTSVIPTACIPVNKKCVISK